MPTIREIAEGCGVTKQTVTARLRELGLWESHVTKDGRAFVVDAYAASAVADALKTPAKATEAPRAASGDRAAVDAYREAIEGLKSALSASEAQQAALVRQLDAKDAQIRSLTDQLAAAHATIDRLSSRSWLDRLLGRGLPPAGGSSAV